MRNDEPEGAGDRLMTLRELADYLSLNQRTVLKLAGEGAVPGIRLGAQWRFKREMIDAWLDDRMLGVRSAPPPPPAASARAFTFEQCLTEAHVVPALAAHTFMGALGELATRAAELGLVRDKTWFLGALVERENVLSSAVGKGVAFPHTLARHPEQVERPFILVGRSLQGLAAGAPDERPVKLVFMLGLRYEELHLPWLARLSSVLLERSARAALLDAAGARELTRRLRELVGEG